jgi:hypothetical protein
LSIFHLALGMRQKFKAYKVQHLAEELLLMSFEAMSFKDRFGRAFPSTVTGHERGTPEKLFLLLAPDHREKDRFGSIQAGA